MGTIQIKKYERKVLVGKKNEQRQQVMRTYGKIIYRGTPGGGDNGGGNSGGDYNEGD